MMNQEPEKFSPDDPRLTAYALGELDGAERAAVEAALRDDAALRAVVEEIRATVAQLEGALATETLPAVPDIDEHAELLGVLRQLAGSAAATLMGAWMGRMPGAPEQATQGWIAVALMLVEVQHRQPVLVAALPPIEPVDAEQCRGQVAAEPQGLATERHRLAASYRWRSG